MNRLLKKYLLLLKGGQYRQIHEWSLGFDLIKTEFNGNPTYFSVGDFDLNSDYFQGSVVIEEARKFVEPYSGLYFDSLEEGIRFYQVYMRNPVVEMIEV